MPNRATKIKLILIIIFTWIFALVMLYIVIMKFKYLSR